MVTKKKAEPKDTQKKRKPLSNKQIASYKKKLRVQREYE